MLNLLFTLFSLILTIVGAVGVLWGQGGDSRLSGWLCLLFFGGALLIFGWRSVRQKLDQRIQSRNVKGQHKPDLDLRIVLYPWKTDALVHLAATCLFAATGLPLVNADSVFMGYAVLGLFGVGALFLLWKCLDGRPRMVLDEHGVMDRSLMAGRIAWKDVESANLKVMGSGTFICLAMRDSDAFLGSLPPMQRKLLGANKAMGFADVNLNLTGVKANKEQVLELVKAQIKRAKKENRN